MEVIHKQVEDVDKRDEGIYKQVCEDIKKEVYKNIQLIKGMSTLTEKEVAEIKKRVQSSKLTDEEAAVIIEEVKSSEDMADIVEIKKRAENLEKTCGYSSAILEYARYKERLDKLISAQIFKRLSDIQYNWYMMYGLCSQSHV